MVCRFNLGCVAYVTCDTVLLHVNLSSLHPKLDNFPRHGNLSRSSDNLFTVNLIYENLSRSSGILFNL
jgi:hypothetical protein